MAVEFLLLKADKVRGFTWPLFSKEEGSEETPRYGMGWVVFAFTIGIGLSGLQGWGDIISLVRGSLVYQKDPWGAVFIPQTWGFFYIFLLGFHWAGTGAVLVAWSGSKNPANRNVWFGRLSSGLLGTFVFWGALAVIPQFLLPGYTAYENYDFVTYPGLEDLYSELRDCMIFSGFVAGSLLYEIRQKDWMNVKMILIPSIITGLSWMALITIFELWVPELAQARGISFNWWRTWESTGGGALGFGFSIAFIVCNKKLPKDHSEQREQRYSKNPNGEKLIGVYLALAIGLAYSTIQAIKGWLHIYAPNNPEFDEVLAGFAIPVLIIFFFPWFALVLRTAQDPLKPMDGRDVTPHFTYVYFLSYILMRELGMQVTWAPEYNFSEIAFFIYYLVLGLLDLGLVIMWLNKNNVGVMKSFKNLKNLWKIRN